MSAEMHTTGETRVDRPLHDGYWSMQVLRNSYLAQRTPAVEWWMSAADGPLNPTEQLIFDHVRSAQALLDVGAGDLRIKSKFERAGFRGRYATLDRSSEFQPDFASFADVPSGAFDAVMLLEVIEHVPLQEFDGLMDEVLRCLAPGGKLVISTPNTAYTASIWDADMTHVHGYRLVDLAAYLHLRDVRSTLYRVAWRWPSPPVRERVRRIAEKVITRWILQLDYARGVLLLGQREH